MMQASMDMKMKMRTQAIAARARAQAHRERERARHAAMMGKHAQRDARAGAGAHQSLAQGHRDHGVGDGPMDGPPKIAAKPKVPPRFRPPGASREHML